MSRHTALELRVRSRICCRTAASGTSRPSYAWCPVQRPGKVLFASSGTGAPSHLAVELLKVLTQTGLVHARAGRLRALAVTSAQRSPAAPELPTMAEAGIPGYEATNWCGLVGPAKMQPAVVARLNG